MSATPSIGRIVLFADWHKCGERAAIITYVSTDFRVSLYVFPTTDEGGMAIDHVPLHSERPLGEFRNPCCWFPPRV